MVGEQVIDVDEAVDRTLECKAGIAEVIRDQKWVVGFQTWMFLYRQLALIAKSLTQW